MIAFFWSGGPVMILLGVTSIVIVALMLYCAYQFQTWRRSTARNTTTLPAFVKQTEGLRRSIQWLSYLANMSTLAGLLGTVVGIHTAFGRLGSESGSPIELMANGIHEAISTTIVGLCLALPALLLHYWFRDRYEQARRQAGHAEAGEISSE